LIVVEVPSNVDIVRANCYCFEFAQFGSWMQITVPIAGSTSK
jgi:hypothetical protein